MVSALQMRRVHAAVDKALAQRILVRPEVCENCNTIDQNSVLHGHHDDYSKPLAVRWLCRSCHIKHHVALRKAEGTYKPGGRWRAEKRKPAPKRRRAA